MMQGVNTESFPKPIVTPIDFAVYDIPAERILSNLVGQASLRLAYAGSPTLPKLTAWYSNVPLSVLLYELYPPLEGAVTVKVASPYVVVDSEPAPNKGTVSLTVKDVDVREALRQWRNEILSWKLAYDLDVRGTVSVSVGKRPGLEVLREILEQVDAYYVIDFDTVRIHRKYSAPDLDRVLPEFEAKADNGFSFFAPLARVADAVIQVEPGLRMPHIKAISAKNRTVRQILEEALPVGVVAEARGWRIYIRRMSR